MKFLILFLFTVNSFAAFTPFAPSNPPADSITAKGNLLTSDGTGLTEKAACANGEIIEWDSTVTEGFKCVTKPVETVDTNAGTLCADGEYLDGNGTCIEVPQGGGGDAGINFVVDASFEKETFAPTVSVAGGTVTYPAYTANDKLYSEFNTKYYQVAHTGLSAANYSVNYSQARTDLSGKQGLFSIWAKVDADLDLCIELDASGTCESTVSLIADNTWRKYEIPFVFGASSVEFNFFNASLTGDITLQLDKAYIGVIPDGYIQDVGQASFVGDINFNSTGCLWTINTGTGFQAFPVNASCSYQTRGNVLAPDTKIPAVKIPNARTDGYYKVVLNGLFGVTQGNVSDVCSFNLSDSTSQNDNGGFAFTETAPGTTFDSNRFANEITGQFKFTTSGDKTIQVLGRPNSSGDSCRIFADAAIYGGTISVHFFPDDNSTIVSQNTELTAQTANEFSAGVLTLGTTERENFDWINGDCVKSGTGNQTGTCTFVSGLFSAPPNCSCTARGNSSDNGTCNIENLLTTKDQIVYHTHLNDVATSSGIELKCSRSTDYNKSATIIGKFENINSSELCQVEAVSNDLEEITALTEDTPFKTIIKDNCGAWSNAGNTGNNTNDAYTAQKDGYVIFQGNTAGNVVDYQYRIYKDGTYLQACTTNTGTTTKQFNCIVNAVKDSVYTIRNTATLTFTASNSENNYIKITELPDTESIIKNLSQEKTKCQTKYLNANVTASGTSDNTSGSYIAQLDDIEFNNLTVGKKYRVFLTPNLQANLTNVMALTAVHNSTFIARFFCGNSAGSSVCMGTGVGDFTASTTTLFMQTDNFTGTSPQLSGNGSSSQTHVRLCELPSTYVETTEW